MRYTNDDITPRHIDSRTGTVMIPSRIEGESYADYKLRQQQMRDVYKYKLRPVLMWNSSDAGTYIKAKHGKLTKGVKI